MSDSLFLIAFRGIRTENPSFIRYFKARKEAAVAGLSADITREECLSYAGHVVIAFASTGPIYGFNPRCGEGQIAKRLSTLRQPRPEDEQIVPLGVVLDDTAVFLAAQQRGAHVLCLECKYETKEFELIRGQFDSELASSRFRYSFYNGGGDCNCATWPGMIGCWSDTSLSHFQTLTGQMTDFMRAMKQTAATAWQEGREHE